MPNNSAATSTAPTKTTADQIEFSKIGKLRVQVVFDEPALSSDGGALLIREAAEINGIVNAMADAITDKRDQAYVKHTLPELISQRVTQICHGYEDANDCDTLRDDLAFKVAVGRRPDGDSLASQPTMSRLENGVGVRDLLRLFYVFVDNFLDSYSVAPECIILDMDPTAHRTYGDQQLSLFNTHYGGYCLMPFHVYDGQTGKLITTVIRPGKTPTSSEIISLLKRLVRRIRGRFPQTQLIFRADSHHTKPEVQDWLENNDVRYVTGMATNAVLRREVEPMIKEVLAKQKDGMGKYRRFHSFSYAAGTWSKKRRIIARIEATSQGVDVRFIVTDLEGAGAKFLYETVYCDRGNAELYIKEHKLFLHSDRTSCTSAKANQFRLCLHSAAYVLMHGIRDTLLKGTQWATATFQTIQLRLLKVAARVDTGKTYCRFHMPETCPTAAIFARAAAVVALLSKT